MAAAAESLQDRTPIEQINATLKGTVVDVLRMFMPSLAPYTNEEAFNLLLSDPHMAQLGFRAFRDHPEAFAEVLRGPENQVISNDNEPLSCGRTLADVVALVVQAVAKRYFRAKLSLRRTTSLPQEATLAGKVISMFKGPAPVQVVKKIPNPGDRLFRALRDYLLFEWQLRLIPYYVGLPVALVQELGERILDFKEIEDIQWMVRSGQALSAPTVRQPESTAPLHIVPDMGPVQPAPASPAVMAEAAAQPTPQQFDAGPRMVPIVKPEAQAKPQPEPPPAPVGSAKVWTATPVMSEGATAQRFVSAILGKVNTPLARKVAQELALNPRQLAAMLIRAYEFMPAPDFQRFGASAPDSDEAKRFITACKVARFGQDTSQHVAAEFSRLYKANIRSMI